MSTDIVDLARGLLRDGLHTEALNRLSEYEQSAGFDLEVASLLGVALALQGRYVEAERYLRAALCGAPEVASLHSNLGNLLREQGRYAEAEVCLCRALELRPGYPDAFDNLGVTQQALGNFKAAEDSFRSALRLQADHGSALRNLGVLLTEQARVSEALPILTMCARRNPGDSVALVTLAQAHRRCGRLRDAEAILDHVLAANLNDVTALIEWGSVLHASGRFAEAEQVWRSAAVLAPDSPEAAFGLGIAAAQAGRYEAAEAALRQAIAARPHYPEALNSLGDVLRNMGRFAESEGYLRAALDGQPAYPAAWISLAFLLLQTGRYVEGWHAYEARWCAEPWLSQVVPATVPIWQGEELGDRSLLVFAEQGLGDTVQFVRYVQDLPLIADVRLQVQAPLVRLIQQSFPGRSVAPLNALCPVDQTGVRVPLLSLPNYLSAASSAPRTEGAYLKADPNDVAAWAARFALLSGLRVGLVWAGNPALTADTRRSIEPELLAPLAQVPGVRYVSLQIGEAQRRATPSDLVLYDAAPDLVDLADTAAAVSCLDLVISVDTVVAHLSAALAKPVWLLNRYDTCWRWGQTEGSSTWYSSLREYRQARPGEWRPVIARVTADLRRAAHHGLASFGSGLSRVP